MTSNDGGLNWGNWRYIDTLNYLVGDIIRSPFAPAACLGTKFAAVYPSYLSSQNVLSQFILASSENHGNSFIYNSILTVQSPVVNDSAKLSYKLLQSPINVNHLIFIFPNNSATDIDIMMVETFDGGQTWTNALRLNDDGFENGKMQDLIWADFDSDGDLVVSWRHRRNTNGNGFNKASEYFATFRDKDSLNFGPNFKLSDSLVNYHPILNESGNDFMGMELENDTIASTWANTRDGSLDIWFSRKSARTGLASSVKLLSSESQLFSVFPNPSEGLFLVKSRNEEIIEGLYLYDLKGELILKKPCQASDIELDLKNLNDGIYILEVFVKGGKSTIKLAKSGGKI